MKTLFRMKRSSAERQRLFPFLDRSRRRDRWFKRTILVVTGLVISALLLVLPKGRYVVASLASEARQAALATIGVPLPRSEVDGRWRRSRLQGIEESRRAHQAMYQDVDEPYRRLMRYSGLDPEHGLLRWGNYDRTLLLPSKVFEADDTGRSYRLRPCVRSVWVRNLTLRTGVLMFFLVPDEPGLAEAVKGTSGIKVEGSQQTTNSWGLRGPEPDLEAPLRGLVLGDSFMQGLFIGDDQTPPESLRRYLESQLKTRVSILNTGHLGYSCEQYYYSLMAFAERFRPQFVVVSIFANDFGDVFEVPQGRGDWEEGAYWLDKIAQFCRSRQLMQLFVAVPLETQMFAKRKTEFYPGRITNMLQVSGTEYMNPVEEFVNAHLEIVNEGERLGRRPPGCPLFNVEIHDGHFSALGSQVWAAAVGRRLTLLLERKRLSTLTNASVGKGQTHN
ncbi:MAG: SGNH/GDSL hydrolase family protein [Isosphaeraceae bacterium]